MFQKEQNLYQYLHWKSSHPRSIYEGIVIGEIGRYIKRCTTRTDFDEIVRLFKMRLKRRGYPEKFLKKAFRKAPKYEQRQELLNKVLTKMDNIRGLRDLNEREEPEKVLRYKYTFEKAYPDAKIIRKILAKHWHTLPKSIRERRLQITTKCNPNLYRTLYCWPPAIKQQEPKKFFANYKAPPRQLQIEEFFRPVQRQQRYRPMRQIGIRPQQRSHIRVLTEEQLREKERRQDERLNREIALYCGEPEREPYEPFEPVQYYQWDGDFGP